LLEVMVNPEMIDDLDLNLSDNELSYWENYIKEHGLDDFDN